MNRTKKLTVLLLSAALCVVSLFSSTLFASAETVIVEDYKNTSLTFVAIHGTDSNSASVWEPVGTYEENIPAGGSTANYKINTNAYAPWWTKDSVHFAYKKMDFAYGKNGTLVLEADMKSWNATMSEEAGAGIMLRTGLDPGATNIMLHCRPSRLMITYRVQDNGSSLKGKVLNFSKSEYPVSFRIVLNAGKAVCYVKTSGSKDFSKFATIPFVCGNTVYSGLAAYSQYKDEIATAEYTYFRSYIETPEGAQRVDGEAGGGNSSDDSSSEEVSSLPEDDPVQANVLMRETFTDGEINPEKEEYPSNVKWYYDENKIPKIVTNGDNTNRYLYDWMEDGVYMYGGDQHWADYTMTADLTFTKEYSDEAANNFYVFVRHTDISQYGCHDYSVCFTGGKKISIGYRTGSNFDTAPKLLTTSDTAGDTVYMDYKYLPAFNESEKTLKLKIKAFDNVITVYLDGAEVLRYTDTTSSVKGLGSVGFLTKESAVMVDNIVVTEETDLLGGAYDNEISGNWDSPIPEIVTYFSENKYKGFE